MRDTKFRAWDKKLKKMWSWEELKTLPLSDLEREDLIWMQFTGLEDKNGNEIYKGDILKTPKLKKVLIVEFELDGWADHTQYAGYDTSYWNDCEIIGNIYENSK